MLSIKNSDQIELQRDTLKSYRSIAFTGGRDFEDKKTFNRVLRIVDHPDFVVIVGCCPTGLDKMVRDFFKEEAVVFEADWHKYGRAAGPLRNKAMLSFKPEILIAFPGGTGTEDCIRQAKKQKIPVLKVEPAIF